MAEIVCVSVDQDEIGCYHDIHGLPKDHDHGMSRAIWTLALRRALELFDRLGVKATFFVVGASMDEAVGGPAARGLVEAGHEAANHTYSHPYDLLRLDRLGRHEELRAGNESIERATGSPPRGFRAPGYNIDDDLSGLVRDLGYAYDSSVFPCPAYYGAKAAAMAAIWARGRRSHSVLGPKEVLAAPAEPYLVGNRFWQRQKPPGQRGAGLVELPVGVLPRTRLPFIGTSLTLAGPRLSALMAKKMARRRVVSLELHGIDFLDAWDGEGLEALAAHQPDLKIRVQRKLASLKAALDVLLAETGPSSTCLQAARKIRPAL